MGQTKTGGNVNTVERGYLAGRSKMGWRFRRAFRIAPGIRLNMGKAGLTSISLGGRGATLNLSKRGATSTVSLPGTGLSYRHRHKSSSSVQPPVLAAGRGSGRPVAIGAGVFAVGVIGGYLALRSPAPSAPSPSVSTVAASEPIPIAAPTPVAASIRTVSTLQANVRGSPSISGFVIRKLLRGQAVQVLEVQNGWTRVALSDGEPVGWMHNSVLK